MAHVGASAQGCKVRHYLGFYLPLKKRCEAKTVVCACCMPLWDAVCLHWKALKEGDGICGRECTGLQSPSLSHSLLAAHETLHAQVFRLRLLFAALTRGLFTLEGTERG
jgi:hypothetical protein